jgi:hypothetical protein
VAQPLGAGQAALEPQRHAGQPLAVLLEPRVDQRGQAHGGRLGDPRVVLGARQHLVVRAGQDTRVGGEFDDEPHLELGRAGGPGDPLEFAGAHSARLQQGQRRLVQYGTDRAEQSRSRRGGLALDGGRVGDGERRQRRTRRERGVPVGPAQGQRHLARHLGALPPVADQEAALDRPTKIVGQVAELALDLRTGARHLGQELGQPRGRVVDQGPDLLGRGQPGRHRLDRRLLVPARQPQAEALADAAHLIGRAALEQLRRRPAETEREREPVSEWADQHHQVVGRPRQRPLVQHLERGGELGIVGGPAQQAGEIGPGHGIGTRREYRLSGLGDLHGRRAQPTQRGVDVVVLAQPTGEIAQVAQGRSGRRLGPPHQDAGQVGRREIPQPTGHRMCSHSCRGYAVRTTNPGSHRFVPRFGPARYLVVLRT